MRRLLVPLIFGLGGTAILVVLAVWQVQRLAWKEALIADLAARATQSPVGVPTAPDPVRDALLSVAAEGRFVGPALHVLTSAKFEGPGFRVVMAFETDGRRLLVDRGFVREEVKDQPLDPGPVTVTGALFWPNETDSFTPEPNLERNIWFARNLETMSRVLETEPVMIVARAPTGTPSPLPQPVGVDVPNNHLQYAITWSLLAICWLGMTGYLVYRIRRNTA